MSPHTRIGPRNHAALMTILSLGSWLLPKVQGTSWCLSDMVGSKCPNVGRPLIHQAAVRREGARSLCLSGRVFEEGVDPQLAQLLVERRLVYGTPRERGEQLAEPE